MVLLKMLLNFISPQLKDKILVFIKSLKSDPPNYANEWDEFTVKLLFTIFEIKD